MKRAKHSADEVNSVRNAEEFIQLFFFVTFKFDEAYLLIDYCIKY